MVITVRVTVLTTTPVVELEKDQPRKTSKYHRMTSWRAVCSLSVNYIYNTIACSQIIKLFMMGRARLVIMLEKLEKRVL